MSKKTVPDVPVFDPTKSYKWEPTDVFTLTGQQFASFYHLLSQEFNVPGGAPVALKAEAHGVMMEVFKLGVISGVITEADPSLLSQGDEAKVKQLFKA